VTEATPKKPEIAQLELNSIDQLIVDKVKGTAVDAEGYVLGVGLDEADSTLRAQLGLATGEGLVVTDVVEDSAAADAGVKAHDVLTVLDGTRLTTVKAVTAQIQEIKDREVELRLLRGGKERSLQLAPRKSDGNVQTGDVHTHWNVNNCQRCHDSGWQMQLDRSAMLDTHKLLVDPYQFHGGAQNFRFLWKDLTANQADAKPTEPQQQLATLKEQLAAMQQTLAKLETALQPQQPADEEKDKQQK
jgi:hypothetical protein